MKYFFTGLSALVVSNDPPFCRMVGPIHNYQDCMSQSYFSSKIGYL